jgi:hypothetical protein
MVQDSCLKGPTPEIPIPAPTTDLAQGRYGHQVSVEELKSELPIDSQTMKESSPISGLFDFSRRDNGV